MAGGFGLLMFLVRFMLMVFGMSLVESLWTSSIATFLGVVVYLWIYVYKTAHAGDQEEKLETEMYKEIEETVVVGGADACTIIAHDSQTEEESATGVSLSHPA